MPYSYSKNKIISQNIIQLLQPAVLNKILLITILISSIYLIVLLSRQRSFYAKDILELAGLSQQMSAIDARWKIQKQEGAAREEYQVIANSRFFQEISSLSDEEGGSVALEEKSKKEVIDVGRYRSLKVKGLIGTSQAIIEDPIKRVTHFVKQGDRIEEATVLSIGSGVVQLKVGDETIELNF